MSAALHFIDNLATTSSTSFTLQHKCLNTSHNVTTDSLYGTAEEIMG